MIVPIPDLLDAAQPEPLRDARRAAPVRGRTVLASVVYRFGAAAAMIVAIPDLRDAAQLRQMRERLRAAEWVSGLATAGHQGARVKHNRQLAEGSPLARELGDT